MTYLAAWCLLSLIGLAAWFLVTPFLKDEHEYETTSENALRSLRAVHVAADFADAAEENDACPRALAATNLGSE